MKKYICIFLSGMFLYNIISATKDVEQESKEVKTYIVNQKSDKASDANSGTEDLPFKTISAAADIAKPGDTVLVYEGIYRERVTPAMGGHPDSPIVYMSAPEETVYIKGSDVFKPDWKNLGNNIYEGSLNCVKFEEVNPFLRTISIASSDKSIDARPSEDIDLPETLGQVFVNGKPYLQVMNLKNLNNCPGTWMVNGSGDAILINFKNEENSPENNIIEVSVRSRIFSPYRRGLKNIHVNGFIMEHCANQGGFPQNGALSVRSGRDWIIENNVIRYAKTCGLDIGSEHWDGKAIAKSVATAEEDQRLIIGGSHLIKNNVISDNGLCGIVGWNHNGSKIVGNTVERNNRLGFPHTKGWEEWAGIKLHCTDTLIAGNLIRDNEAHGIWIDNGYRNAHITRNVVINNLQSGIFLELGGEEPNALIDNNIIGFTRSQGGFYNGNGIYMHDASNVTMAHNLLIANAGFGVNIRVITDRKYAGKKVLASNHKILNNIFIGNSLGCICLPADSSRSGNNFSDYNFFDIGGGKGAFYINKFSADFDWNELTSYLESTLKTNSIEQTLWPNFNNWKSSPNLTFEAWQVLMGMDENSIKISAHQGKTGIKLRSRQPELFFKAGENLLDMKCPKVEDAYVDFYGNVIPETGALPGPFQNITTNSVVFPLINVITNPMIRLTPAQKEQKRQKEFIENEAKDIIKGTQEVKYNITDKESDNWFFSEQKSASPNLVSEYTRLTPFKSTIIVSRSTPKGPTKGPSKVVLFKAPEEGIYKYDFDGRLIKRTAASAGYASAEIYLIDSDMKNAVSLEKQYANTEGGYRSNVYNDQYLFSGEIKMKKSWYLAVRFQVVSPGPAPAGYGHVEINNFIVTKK